MADSFEKLDLLREICEAEGDAWKKMLWGVAFLAAVESIDKEKMIQTLGTLLGVDTFWSLFCEAIWVLRHAQAVLTCTHSVYFQGCFLDGLIQQRPPFGNPWLALQTLNV